VTDGSGPGFRSALAAADDELMPTPRRKSKSEANVDEDLDKSASLRPDEMPPDVLEFITAIDDYKRTHRRPFPNWSEVLDVVKSLGYTR